MAQYFKSIIQRTKCSVASGYDLPDTSITWKSIRRLINLSKELIESRHDERWGESLLGQTKKKKTTIVIRVMLKGNLYKDSWWNNELEESAGNKMYDLL